jgi:hypothetical protein
VGRSESSSNFLSGLDIYAYSKDTIVAETADHHVSGYSRVTFRWYPRQHATLGGVTRLPMVGQRSIGVDQDDAQRSVAQRYALDWVSITGRRSPSRGYRLLMECMCLLFQFSGQPAKSVYGRYSS